MKKSCAFFASLLCGLSLIACSTNAKILLKQDSPSSSAKLADKPKDRAIKIITHDKYELCYIPTFSIGAEHYSYVGILNCALSEAKSARYDVFSRLAYNISNTWLCITAPSSVQTGLREYDYVQLSPCVINDNKQQWKLKNGSFYSLDESYMIKDDGSYLYAVWSKDKEFHTHTLHDSMQSWQETLATPGNISIVTYIAWDLMTKDGNQRYFLKNNQSDKNTMPLYYNIESGHIAQYDALGGALYCMYSKIGKNDWDWVEWGLCDDSKPPLDNKAFFKFVLVGENKVRIEDKDNNVLRLTRYGIHWGVPYVAKKDYIAKDTSNAPISEFSIPQETSDWLRFSLANIGENLPFCPAPGSVSVQNPPLVPDFSLTPQWRQRLMDIARSNDGTMGHISGVCGVCLLHTYQILAEILENPHNPRSSGGYFFDTRMGIDPFVSFRARNSLLYGSLSDMMSWFAPPTPRSYDDTSRNTLSLALATSISMLPQYNWSIFAYANTQAQINATFQNMINAQPGNVFIVLPISITPEGRFVGHALAMIRLNQGLVILPTNMATLTPATFNIITTPLNDVSSLLQIFTQIASVPHARVLNVGVLNANTFYHNSFEGFVSVANCTGEGEDRRGSASLPSASFINQCASGRCHTF